MLVLSRKNGEKIQIGDEITLTVVSVRGKRVKIGIDAPRECRVVRHEVDTPKTEADSPRDYVTDDSQFELALV